MTRQINVGGVLIGGGAPVVIQSMLNTKTTDVQGSLSQLKALAAAGCQVARLAIPNQEAAKSFAEICKESLLPLVADIHFDYKLAIAAMENGADIGSMPQFADDELGDIARHIIALYGRLREASNDIQREHDKAMHEHQEKLRIKRQLTNNINHELKTPVAAIQGYLETMTTAKDMTAEERDAFIAKCYAHCQRLTQLLNDVSTITRLEDGSSRIECESVDLHAIINEIASEVALLPDDKRMRMNIELPTPMPVMGNSTLLMSIFKNLTDNAIAYSGGRDIFVRCTEEDKMYTISFYDNGIGVDNDHINHIFERFYRIDKGRSRKLGGTGLGLAIVKNAVLFHGGDISIANRRTGGLEFKITLPRA